jgi:superfamily I DNA/RNA helicase
VLEDLSGRYKDISDFLADFSLLEPPEKIPRIYDDGESITAEEKPVTLSTIHSAKGLEWDVVFIIAAMDGSIPSYYSLDSEEKVEEERRLMYVAVTRCRRSLYMSMHRYSTRAGLSQICDLSRFLREPELLEGINHNLSNTDVMFPSFKSFDRNRFYREMLDKFKRT